MIKVILSSSPNKSFTSTLESPSNPKESKKRSKRQFCIFEQNLDPDDLEWVSPTNREILFHSSRVIFGRMESTHGGLPNLGVVNGPLKTLGLAKF